MGKRLVLPALAVLAALCLPGVSREASAQVPDVVWQATFTLKGTEVVEGSPGNPFYILGCDLVSRVRTVGGLTPDGNAAKCTATSPAVFAPTVGNADSSKPWTFRYPDESTGTTYEIERFRFQGSNQSFTRFLDFWLKSELPSALTSALKLCIGHVGYSFSDRDTRTSGVDNSPRGTPSRGASYEGRAGRRYRWTSFPPTAHFFGGGPTLPNGFKIGTPSSAWGTNDPTFKGGTVKVGLAKDCSSISPPPPVTNLRVAGGRRTSTAGLLQATWSDPADSTATSWEVHFTGSSGVAEDQADAELGIGQDGTAISPSSDASFSNSWIAPYQLRGTTPPGKVTARTVRIEGAKSITDDTLSSLNVSNEYWVRVRAVAGSMKSAWTVVSGATAAGDSAQSSDATLSALKVEWSSSADGTYRNLPLEEVPVAPDDSTTDERYVAATVGTHVKITATAGAALQQIEWKLGTGSFSALVSAVPSAAIELPSGNFYQFSVKVTAEDGTIRDYLVELSKEGTENEPHPPRSLSVEPISATSLLLNWGLRPIPGASGDATVAPSGYEVHYTTSSTVGQSTTVRTDSDASMGWVAATHSGTSTRLALSSLTSSTRHWVRVRSVKSYTDAMNDPQTETSHWVFGEGTTGEPTRTVQFENTEQLCVESLVSDNANCPVVTVQISSGLTYPSSVEIRPVTAESSFSEFSDTLFNLQSCVRYQPFLPWICADIATHHASISGGKYDIPLTTQATAVSPFVTTVRNEEVSANDPSLREVVELAVFELSRVSGAPYVIGANSKIKVRMLDNTLTTSFNPIENLTLATTSDSVTATWDGVGTITDFDVHYTSAAPSAVADDAAASGNDVSAGWVAVDHTFSGRDGASQAFTGLDTGTNYRVRVRAIYQEYYNDPDRAWDDWAHAEARTLPTVSLSVSPNPVTEGSDATVEVTLSTTLAADVTIPLTYTDDATDPPDQGDYTAPVNLTVTAGNTSASGTISAAQDTDAEDEAFSVALGTLPITVTAGSASSVDFRILDDDKAPLVPDTLGVRVGINQLRLTWTQPADTRTEVAAVSGYDVHYTSALVGTVANDAAVRIGSDASAGWVGAGHSGTDTTHTITGLVNDRAYRVRVRAYNGNVERSGWVLGSGTPSELPTVSLSVSSDSVTEGSSVTVTATLSATQSSATTIPLTLTSGTGTDDADYGMLASITIAANSQDGTGTGDITTAQDTDAEDETFTVALGTLPTGFVEGSPASIVVTIRDDDKPPKAPESLNVEGRNAQLKLSWTQPADDRTEVVAVSAYDVHYTSALVGSVADDAAASGNDASAAWVDASHSGTDTMHTISGLTNSTEYRVRVRADNGKAEKSAWTHGTGTPVPPTVSLSVSPNPVIEGSPVTVTATLSEAQSSDSAIGLTLTSGAGTVDDDYGRLSSITIAADAQSGTGTISTTDEADTSDETFTVALGTLPTGFEEGSPASIEVKILDDDKPPKAPTELKVTPRNEELALGWKQPADGPEVAAVSGYDVHYTSAADGTVADADAASGTDASAAWVDSGHSGTALEHSISGLVNDTLYRVRVRAENSKGRSDWVHGEGTPSSQVEETTVVKQSLEALAGTIMGSAVSRIGERVESSEQPSQPLAGDADGSASLLRTLSILFGLPQPGDPSAGAKDTRHDRFQAHRAHWDEVTSPGGRGPGASRYASGQLRLNSFSFSLDEPSDAGASGSGVALVLWGRGDYQSFRGNDRGSFEDALSYSGSWKSLYLGIDQGFGEGRLAGVALSSGRGKVNYRYGESERQKGRYEARLKTVYPYFSAEVADGTRLWATVGYGRGEISNYRAAEEEPGAGDLRLGLAVVAAKHELNEWPSARLSLVGDAGHARLKVKSDVRPLVGLQTKVSRIRAGVEVTGKNYAAAPYLRASARFERGDTTKRKGLEAEGGIRWSGVRYGADLNVRALRLRGKSASYRETGIGTSFYYSPSSDGTGASLTLSHDWGRPRGSDTLWQNGSLSVTDSESVADTDSARSLNAELGYGLYSERLHGLVTPKLGWREDSAGERRLRFGAAYRANSWLTHQVGVEFGIHRRRTQSGVADYGGDLNASMNW